MYVSVSEIPQDSKNKAYTKNNIKETTQCLSARVENTDIIMTSSTLNDGF